MGLSLIPSKDTASTIVEIPIHEYTIIGGNSLVGIISHIQEENLVYGAIIARITHCESTDRPEVINPNDKGSPSYGIAQFKIGTYHRFCMEKYGMDGDIMNPRNQRKCMDLMLQDDWNNIWNWANCYKLIK